jgi:hypothetical protein
MALFLAGSLMQSRNSTANGAFASPVMVMNTTANSVPSLDAERVARVPYESTSQPLGSCGSSSGLAQCSFSFPGPPSGFRLVVENLGGWVSQNSGASAPIAVLNNFDGGRNTWWSVTGTMGPLFNTIVQCSFNQNMRAVFDTVDLAPNVNVTADWRGGVGQYVTLTGYLENCGISGCPTKVH